MSQKLKVNSLNEQAYFLIKEKIINKEFLPGMRLVDSALAEQFGISRTPCRDAIRKLADEGLVISSDKKGYSVFLPSEKDIYEIYEVRYLIEAAAIKKLIEEIIPRNPAVLEDIEKAYKQTLYVDMEQKVTETEKFHMSIILPLNNSRLTANYKDLLTQTRVFRCNTLSDNEKQKQTQYCHEKLFEAIKAQNIKAAMDALNEHNRVGIEIDISDIRAQ